MIYTVKSTDIWMTRYAVTDENGEKLGSIEKNMWHTNATVKAVNQQAFVKSEKWYSTRKVIEQNGETVGSADFKTSSFKPRIVIEYKGRTFHVKAKDLWERTYFLYLDEHADQPIGEIRKRGFWDSSYESDMPDNIDLWFQVVLVSLLMTFDTLKTTVVS